MQSDGSNSKSSVWDEEANNYDDSRQTDPVYNSCVRQVNVRVPNGVPLLLDAGCGTGMSTVGFSGRAKNIIAVDYSLESLKVLKSKGLTNVFIVQADVFALPFLESVFNYSACVNTLQHFKPGAPQEKAISELRRVTNVDNPILISVHHFSRRKRRDGWIKEGKPGQAGIDYIFRFNKDDLMKLLPKASIIAVGYYSFDRIKFVGGRIQNLAAVLFGRIAADFGFGHMLIGVVKNNKESVDK